MFVLLHQVLTQKSSIALPSWWMAAWGLVPFTLAWASGHFFVSHVNHEALSLRNVATSRVLLFFPPWWFLAVFLPFSRHRCRSKCPFQQLPLSNFQITAFLVRSSCSPLLISYSPLLFGHLSSQIILFSDITILPVTSGHRFGRTSICDYFKIGNSSLSTFPRTKSSRKNFQPRGLQTVSPARINLILIFVWGSPCRNLQYSLLSGSTGSSPVPLSEEQGHRPLFSKPRQFLCAGYRRIVFLHEVVLAQTSKSACELEEPAIFTSWQTANMKSKASVYPLRGS